MAIEYKLAYTVAEIDEKLGKVGSVSIKKMFLEAGACCEVCEGYGSDIIGVMFNILDEEGNDITPCGDNIAILDIGIAFQDGTEIRSSEFPQIANFDADAVHYIYAMPQFDDEMGGYVFFRVRKDNHTANSLINKLLGQEYSGINVYYLGGN